MTRCLKRDLAAAAAAAVLVAVAVLVGHRIQREDGTLHVNWPPLSAVWEPHVGPGTVPALVLAVAVALWGPTAAARLRWGVLPPAVWGAATAWTFALALVDGWQRGVVERMENRHEYLAAVDRFADVPAALRGFTDHILIDSPDNWPTHVAGHPPGATLTFVLLDRVGLGGGGWAGAFCIVVGASVCAAVVVAVRALAGESLARGAAPFLVLVPGAVWMGTSADAYFAAVAGWAVAFLALALTGRSVWWAAAAGLLFGWACHLSYGLVLLGVLGAAVLLLGARTVSRRPVVVVLLLTGTAVVPVAFALLGFDWWEAYRLLVDRYHQGAGGVRPYGYWVWANLACTVLVVGLATVAGLRRAGGVARRARRSLRGAALGPGGGGGAQVPDGPVRLAVLVAGALLTILVADLSGMSKAETERIWLPFALWLVPACALLGGARGWLAAQAAVALAVNHCLLTSW
ncbi:hypothetical protein [Streptomyces lonarensis]|uniref:Integral membrane protein n=2 Tax=Streptomyces lonarensis TaxID=700599 RepID=A0A7X6HZI6_9ACTN|nr:hypothetical protein [Streptomyces lonarensis]NJQ06688.1 hypothetical protein [Streptomyces lonarensis]